MNSEPSTEVLVWQTSIAVANHIGSHYGWYFQIFLLNFLFFILPILIKFFILDFLKNKSNRKINLA